MRHLALTLSLIVVTLPALAAETRPRREPSPAQQAQYERMRSCNATARERTLRGDPRKAFLRDCLSKRGVEAGAAKPG